MMKYTLMFFVVLTSFNVVSLAQPSCPCQEMASLPFDLRYPSVSVDVGGKQIEIPGRTLQVYGKVTDGLYRGSRPQTEADFAYLKRLGIKTLFSIQWIPWHSSSEEKLAAKYGFNYRNVPIQASPLAPDEKDVGQSLAIMRDKSLYPMFIHCYVGRDRTGLVIGLFRVKEQGCHPNDAWNEMKNYTFGEGFQIAGLKSYFVNHVDFNSSAPQCSPKN